MRKILILGKTGMLGSMLYYYFSKQGEYDVFTTSREESKQDQTNLFFDAEKSDMKILEDFVFQNKIEYILNAIGVIKPYCKDDNQKEVEKAILVNSAFPHKLSNLAKQLNIKIIQIATDCVYDGSEGNYTENSLHNALDVYGKTKSLGEINDKTILNIRCSIIGPEIKSKVSLLEWFLSQNSEIKGFTHHKWNGVTTLRFAQLIDEIIKQDLYNKLIDKSPTFNFVPNYVLTKYEMLEIFKKTFKKDISITPVNNCGPSIDRTLSTIFNDLKPFSDINFKEDVEILKILMDKDFYK